MVSGDGDFAELLRYLKSHGCRCEVIAFGQTASKHIKEEADDFLDLSQNTGRYLINHKGKRPMQRRPPIANVPKKPAGSNVQRKIIAATTKQKEMKTNIHPRQPLTNKNVKTPVAKQTRKTPAKTPVKKKTPVTPRKLIPAKPPKLNQASQSLDPIQQALMAANLKQVDKKKK